MLLAHLILLCGLIFETATSKAPEAQSRASMSIDTDSQAPLSRPLNTLPPLFDSLLLQRSSSIFFDYLREVPSISKRIADLDLQTTLLVPSNKAVIALGWKPGRGPPAPGGTKTAADGTIEISEKTLNENVERWVGAHIIPLGRVDFHSQLRYPTLLEGKDITFARNESVEPGDHACSWQGYGVVQGDLIVPITNRVEASNGVLYLIDGTVSLN